MHRRRAFSATGLVALIVTSGCIWSPVTGTTEVVPVIAGPLPSVSIYGDSLTIPASQAVSDRLDDSVELTIHAYPGTDYGCGTTTS